MAILTKRGAEASNTAWAQGGIAWVLGAGRSMDQHVADTLDAGAGLCKEEVVRAIVTEGPERIEELIDRGVQFDSHGKTGCEESISAARAGTPSGAFCITATPRARRCHAPAGGVPPQPGITIHENHFAIDLITTAKLGLCYRGPRAWACMCWMKPRGEVDTFRCDRVMLATGGCGRVYLYTTNPEHRHRRRRGDGLAGGRGDCEHGVHPVPPHLPLSSAEALVPHHRSHARRGRAC